MIWPPFVFHEEHFESLLITVLRHSVQGIWTNFAPPLFHFCFNSFFLIYNNLKKGDKFFQRVPWFNWTLLHCCFKSLWFKSCVALVKNSAKYENPARMSMPHCCTRELVSQYRGNEFCAAHPSRYLFGGWRARLWFGSALFVTSTFGLGRELQ